MRVIHPLLICIFFLANTVKASPTSKPDQPQSQPAGYWSFDYENAIDHSGNGLDGTFNGDTIFEKGISGQALFIDPDEQNYLQVSSNDNWAIEKPFAIALWMQLFDQPESPMAILSRSSTQRGDGLVVYVDSELFLHIEATNTAGEKIHKKTVSPLIIEEWQHLTINYNGAISANSFFITVNGFEAGLVNLTNTLMTPPQAGAAPLNIGGFWDENNIGTFLGTIDEVYLYQKALNSSEVFCLSQLGVDCLIPHVKGIKGDAGEKGEKGDRGLKGRQGPTGIRGAKGKYGDKGKTGPKGEKGPTGLKGLAGLKGLTGAPGHKGDQGDRGPKGNKGSQGVQGPQGPRGNAGPIASSFQDMPKGSLSGYCQVNTTDRSISFFAGATESTNASPQKTCSCAAGWTAIEIDSTFWCIKN